MKLGFAFACCVLCAVSVLGWARPASAAEGLFWSAGSGGIFGSSLNGTSPTTRWNAATNDVALDRFQDRLFWGQGTSVMKGAADGSGAAASVASVPGINALLMAYDGVEDMVYWGDWNNLQIYRAPVSTGVPQLVLNPPGLRDFALDPRVSQRKLYYSTGGAVFRSNLDGSNIEALGGYGGDVASIAIDTCANRLFVLAQTTPHPGVPVPFIRYSELDGSSQQTILSGSSIGCTNPVDDASGLALDLAHEKVYWASHTCAGVPIIRSCGLDGSSPATLVTGSATAGRLRGIQVDYNPSCGPCDPQSQRWVNVAPTGAPPTNRSEGTIVYDPINHRHVLFGGYDGAYRNDVWTAGVGPNPVWKLLTPGGTSPVGRASHTAIYDAPRRRMIVFGGSDGGSYRNDVWELSLTAGSEAWNQLLPAGTKPGQRRSHTAIYDPIGDRMIVFGGYFYQNDTWSLSLSGAPTWQQLNPTGLLPAVRQGHTAVYDAEGQRMIVFGGEDGSDYRNDVWSLSLGCAPAWNEIVVGGVAPSKRRYQYASLDSATRTLVVFGGQGNAGLSRDVWRLSLADPSQWIDATPSGGAGPTDRQNAMGPGRDVNGYLYVFGGIDPSGATGDFWALRSNDVCSDSVCRSPSDGWTNVVPNGAPPNNRAEGTIVYDPVNQRLVLFGGYDGTYHNDVWTAGLGPNPAWTQLFPGGTGPPVARSSHTAIYDAPRHRMIVFGGSDGGAYRNDVWELSLTAGSEAWNQLNPIAPLPPPRRSHAAIYDATGERMIVFGGYFYLNDTWSLSLSGPPAWQQLAPAGTPPDARQGHSAVYDRQGQRMIVFGGEDGNDYRNDVWSLSLGCSPKWSEIPVTGVLPTERRFHYASLDSATRTLSIFGGQGAAGYTRDVWSLPLSNPERWFLTTPSAGSSPTARANAMGPGCDVNGTFYLFGGNDVSGKTGDLWALRARFCFPTQTLGVRSMEELSGVRLLAAPNPFQAATSVAFTLAAREAVSVGIYDVAGRSIRMIDAGVRGPGPVSVHWDGRDSHGSPAQAGIYMVKVRMGAMTAFARVVRVH